MDYKNLLVGGSQTTPSSSSGPSGRASASPATVSSSAESCPEPSIPCVYPLQGPDLEAINNIVKSKLSSGSSRNYLLSGMQGWVWYKHPENETLMYEYNKIHKAIILINTSYDVIFQHLIFSLDLVLIIHLILY